MLKKILCVCLSILLAGCAAPGVAENQKVDFATQYLQDLMSGEKNADLYAMFDDTAKAQISEAVFSSLWGQLTAAYGSLQGTGEVQTKEQSGMTGYLLPLTFEKQSLILQLVVNKDGKIVTLMFTNPPAASTPAPQAEVQKPASIVEEEVTVGEGEWALPGTLTLPAAGSVFPAVVLVQGSGPSNRDEAVGGTKTFRDIAWYLAQNGIAVLRYDKRTYARGSQFTQDMITSLTVEEETIQDALLAGNLLKSDSRINKDKIFLLGHSLGAMLGPRTVSESNGLFAGMVLMAGSPLRLTDIIIAQNEAGLAKLTKEMQDAQRPALDAEIQKAASLDTVTAEEAKSMIVLGQPGFYHYEMNKVSAAQKLQELKLPTLILQGGNDFQVTVKNGLDAWKTAIGEPDYVTYKLYPELNHLMMAYTGDPAYQFTVKEYDTPANVDPKVLQDITDWILAHL